MGYDYVSNIGKKVLITLSLETRDNEITGDIFAYDEKNSAVIVRKQQIHTFQKASYDYILTKHIKSVQELSDHGEIVPTTFPIPFNEQMQKHEEFIREIEAKNASRHKDATPAAQFLFDSINKT